MSFELNKATLSRRQKREKSFQYYKNQIDEFDNRSFGNRISDGFYDDGYSDYDSMETNYKLFNNILNLEDFKRVCEPYGKGLGDLPAELTNRDILSTKIKSVLGMLAQRPLSYKLNAVNKEATTRREQEEFNRIREYVIAEIQQALQQNQEEGQQIPTPPEIRKYMERDYQDPAEVLGTQILEYLTQKEDLKLKFEEAGKHGAIAAKEVFWIGEKNNEPSMRVINPRYFDYDRSDPNEFQIENKQWAICEYRWSIARIVEEFNDELTKEIIDKLYRQQSHGNPIAIQEHNSIWERGGYDEGIRVLHVVWKGLRKIGFRTYMDEQGEEQMMLVDESYKLDRDAGDVNLEWKWVGEVHEGYKMWIEGEPYYFKLGPVVGQFKDLDNLYECKLPYVGIVHDSHNAEPTSLMDRGKQYQYLYNIIMFRIELLMAHDKGKIMLANIGVVPKSQDVDTKKWLHYVESTKFGFFNPAEEGNDARFNYDAASMAKVFDMSLSTEINQYIQLAEYIENSCGRAIGIPKEMEARIGNSQAVGNVQQQLVQSSYILESFFRMHDLACRNALMRLLEVAKVTYSSNKRIQKLSYVLDDMSLRTLSIDSELLDNSTYGIFIPDNTNAFRAKETAIQLAHAASQNQMIDISDIVKIITTNDAQQIQEMLAAAEKRKAEQQQQQATQIEEMRNKAAQQQREYDKEMAEMEHQFKLEEIDRKGQYDLQKQAMLSLGFSEDKDMDKDGKPDILEVYQQGLDNKIKINKDRREEEKLQLEKQKLKQNNKKSD